MFYNAQTFRKLNMLT